ncbi:MAG: GNAT family N-acetyltransferase [Candidatus Thorarchaeota archaeon]
MILRYATPEDALLITKTVYYAFNNKFAHLVPDDPSAGFPLFYNYYLNGLRKIKEKIIISLGLENEIYAILVIDGLGIPIFSGNPPLSVIIQLYKDLGFKKLLRLIIGILLIEGYPPSSKYLYINTIIVKSKYRGKQIGSTLMKKAELIAKKRHLKGLCLYVARGNKRALNLYRRLGYNLTGGFGNRFVVA